MAKAVIARPSLYRMSVRNRIVVSRLRAPLLFDHLLLSPPPPLLLLFDPASIDTHTPLSARLLSLSLSLSLVFSPRAENKKGEKKRGKKRKERARRSGLSSLLPLHCDAAPGGSRIEISAERFRGSRYHSPRTNGERGRGNQRRAEPRARASFFSFFLFHSFFFFFHSFGPRTSGSRTNHRFGGRGRKERAGKRGRARWTENGRRVAGKFNIADFPGKRCRRPG